MLEHVLVPASFLKLNNTLLLYAFIAYHALLTHSSIDGRGGCFHCALLEFLVYFSHVPIISSV